MDIWTKAYVINLDERLDRWTAIQDQLGRVGIVAERFSAISVANLPAPAPDSLRQFLLDVDGPSASFEHKLQATWACLYSHLAVIRHAQQQRLPAVLILEDDCLFEPYTPGVLRRVRAQLVGQSWDMLYLGGTLKKGSQRVSLTENLRCVSRVRLAHALVIHESLYARILAEAPAAGLPLDWYYSEHLLPEIEGRMVWPRLAFQRLNDVSSIEGVMRPRKFRSRLFWTRCWARLRYWR